MEFKFYVDENSGLDYVKSLLKTQLDVIIDQNFYISLKSFKKDIKDKKALKMIVKVDVEEINQKL